MFNKILVGYDGSPYAKKALEYAIDFAMQPGAELTIVTAFKRVPEYLGSPQFEELAGGRTSKAGQLAEMAADQARACGVENVQVEVLGGNPAECILTAAETHHCDCIVVGSHGNEGLAGLLLGGVTDRLTHHAKIPLLIAR